MKVALDTNVLAYAEGVGDAERRLASQHLLAAIPPDNIIVPAQALGE